jgi:flagellar biosynthesis/type III secretory pathway protein FliH
MSVSAAGIPESPMPDSTRTASEKSLRRVSQALTTCEMFDRAQAAYLIAWARESGYASGLEVGREEGFAAGYQACEAEWNAAAAQAVGAFTERDVTDGLSRKWLREQADAAARAPRPEDFPGGEVTPW